MQSQCCRHSPGISKARAGCPAELRAVADAAGARAPADVEAAPADPLGVRGVLGGVLTSKSCRFFSLML
eukprot:6273761-Pyramimonas_sp.AAC.1